MQKCSVETHLVVLVHCQLVGGFLYPAKLRCRADPLDPSASVNNFITKHFAPVEDVGSWVVMRRNSGFARRALDR
jgi:hypothetical protein